MHLGAGIVTVETSGICRSLTTSRLLLGGWCNASHSLEVLLECLALLHDLSLLSIEVTVGIDTTDRAQRIINKDVDIRSIKQVFADGLGSSQCSCNGIKALLEGIQTEAVLSLERLICSEKRLIGLGAEDASLDDGPAEAFDEFAVVTAIDERLNHGGVIVGAVGGLEGTDEKVDMKLHSVDRLWDGRVVNSLVGTKSTSVELCREEVVEERDDIANPRSLCNFDELS